MTMMNSNVTTALANEWESANRLAVETMERVSRWPFEVIAVEIDGLRV